METSSIRILILGLGSIGRRHGRNFASLGCEIIGFDPNPERCEEFIQEIPTAQTYCDFEEALTSQAVFAVIASPNKFHVEQAMRCAKVDMHMLIEKPLANENQGLDALEAEISKRNLLVHVGSNWKFHPSVKLFHDLISQGKIGKILAVQAIGGQYLPDWHPWEDYRLMYSSRKELGGGVLHDCHDLDYLSWCLGDIKSVACRIANTGMLEIDTSDLLTMMIEFENGCVGTVQIDYLQRPNSRRVHVTGSEGTLIWDFIKGVVEHYSVQDKQWHMHPVPENYDINQMYIDQSNHYLDCIRQGTPTLTPLSHARHVVDIFECCKASSASGGNFMEVRHG